jgi:hypothetical protein
MPPFVIDQSDLQTLTGAVTAVVAAIAAGEGR